MKRLLLIFGIAGVMVTTCVAQSQSAQRQNDMTGPELRQVLVDLGTYLDAHKGTNLASQFEAIPDDLMEKMVGNVANPRQFQSAVAALKEHAAKATPLPPRAQISPNFGVGSGCGTDVIINNSTACTPAYPDPTNSAWDAMANALIGISAFSPNDLNDASSQGCGLSTEITLQQVTVVLTGLEQSLTPACSIIPAPLNGICFGALIAIAVADSASAGLFSDCVEQDGLVNAAEIDAGFHNTVTIYDALNSGFKDAGTQLTNVNNQITTEFGVLGAQVGGVDLHLTNVDNHIATEFTTLTGVVNQATAQLNAELKQIMKLELTPDGLKVIDPPILTCTGTNCPNVLAHCPAAGCSWNNAGPLP